MHAEAVHSIRIQQARVLDGYAVFGLVLQGTQQRPGAAGTSAAHAAAAEAAPFHPPLAVSTTAAQVRAALQEAEQGEGGHAPVQPGKMEMAAKFAQDATAAMTASAAALGGTPLAAPLPDR
jgi:hypothetical protein